MHESADYQKAIKWAYLSDKIAWDEQSSDAQEVRQLAEKGLLAIDESPQTAPLMPRVCIPLMEQLLAQRDLANEPNTANAMLRTLLAAVQESALGSNRLSGTLECIFPAITLLRQVRM